MSTETNKKQKTTITVMENTPFEGDLKTNLVSTTDMAEIVSSLFGAFFADYHGCKIGINNGQNHIDTVPANAIYVELYFKDRGNAGDRIKNLKLRGQVDTSDGKNSMAERFRQVAGNMNPQVASRVYEVTPETYEALEEFVDVLNPHNVNWNRYTQEMSVNMGTIGTKEEAVVCITGLSLNRILTKIYGNKTEEGNFEYSAMPTTMIPARTNEFIMQVTQLNLETVRKLNRELGFNMPSSSQYHVWQ